MVLQRFMADILVIVFSLVVLGKASQVTIKNASRVAGITGIGRTAVGFILVSLSTSLPELSVALFSTASYDSAGIAVGNVLGSNIINVSFILGVVILYASVKDLRCLEFLPLVTRDDVKELQFGIFLASIIPLILLYIGYASRYIGLILIGVFTWNTYKLVKSREEMKEEGSLGEERRRLGWYVALVISGSVAVIGASYFIVGSASSVAALLGVPRVLIGGTIVAFGTSIPELATSLEAVKTNNMNMAMGNIVGSGFLNITLILGVTLAASEFAINVAAFSNLVIFSLMANLFLWYFLNGDRICWREGALLVTLYVVFLITSISEIL